MDRWTHPPSPFLRRNGGILGGGEAGAVGAVGAVLTNDAPSVSLVLGACDIIFACRNVISPIYLADAVIELVFAGYWLQWTVGDRRTSKSRSGENLSGG